MVYNTDAFASSDAWMEGPSVTLMTLHPRCSVLFPSQIRNRTGNPLMDVECMACWLVG